MKPLNEKTIYSFETKLKLSFQVHFEQWETQTNLKDSPYGQLSVQMKFQNDILRIRILNAKNLIAMDSNGCFY